MLHRSSVYSAVRLGGNDFLLPFGQGIVDLDVACRISESARVLWDILADNPTQEELTERFIRAEQVPSENREEAGRDTLEWVRQMKKRGLIREDGSEWDDGLSFHNPFCMRCRIADLTVDLEGSSSWFSEELQPFAVPKEQDADEPDQLVTVTLALPHPHPGAVVLLENDELCVLDEGEAWRILYPSSHILRMARVSKDGRRAVIHLDGRAMEDTKHLHYDLFHALRLLFLIRARKRGCYALHSASFLYRGRVYLVSASSGTGKSTHVNLWADRGWASVLNGDLNLIAPVKNAPGQFEVRGIPWCGTSGIMTTRTVPLGGIILLKRSKDTDEVSLIRDAGERQLRTMQRLITPSWTKEELMDCLRFTGALTERIPVWDLACTPRPSAASVMKEAIDRETEGCMS